MFMTSNCNFCLVHLEFDFSAMVASAGLEAEGTMETRLQNRHLCDFSAIHIGKQAESILTDRDDCIYQTEPPFGGNVRRAV
jgi:hypothetical protein